MRAWHFSAVVLLSLTAASQASAQPTPLVEVVKPGDCFRYSVETKLQGEMSFQKDSGAAKVKLAANASHVFPERVLVAPGSIIHKAARIYETAKIRVERGNASSAWELRQSRKLVVAQRHKEQAMAYSPVGALYRNELDLVSGHFDTLTLAGLLPVNAVKVGETWKVSNPVAQALCGLEGLTDNKLEGKLEKVDASTATFAVSGPAAGVEAGAMVKLTVEAAGTFDLKAKRLTRVVWKQKSQRDQGPVSPASALEVTVTVDRRAMPLQPVELSDVALVSVPEGFTPPGPMSNLEYRDPKDRFALLHPRDWHLTAVTGEHTVLRLMDRGDYVAQVTVTPWTPAKKGEHLTPEQFKAAMRATSGWRPERELQASEVPAEGKYIYRLSEQGMLDGTQVLQNFFLVAAPTGEQVVLTFTLAPKLADKLGARDVSMAASIEVPATPEKK